MQAGQESANSVERKITAERHTRHRWRDSEAGSHRTEGKRQRHRETMKETEKIVTERDRCIKGGNDREEGREQRWRA